MPDTERPLSRGLAAVSHRLAQVERLVSLALLAGIFGLMAAQVIARYGLGSPIAWSEEAARLGLIWLTFMAASFVMADGRHIAVDVVSRPMGRRGRLVLECAGGAVVLSACALIVPAGLTFARQMGMVRSAALGIPMSWWYMAAVVGFALIGLHAAINLVLAFSRGRPVWDRPGGPPDPGVLT